MAFTTFKTPDGRWEYGTGEYNKTIASYLGVKAPPPSTSISAVLADVLFPQKKMTAQMIYATAQSVTIPTFYIWAIAPDGMNQKRIAEWPFAKSLRDAAFPAFRMTMDNKSVGDKQRVDLIKQMQTSAGVPSLTNLARLAAVEKQALIYSDIDNRVRHAAAEAAEEGTAGVFLVLAVAAAIGLFIAFR